MKLKWETVLTLLSIAALIIGAGIYLGRLDTKIASLEAAQDFKTAKDKALTDFKEELVKLASSVTPGESLPIGTIMIWPGSTTPEKPLPKNWLPCDGSELPTAGNEALFRIIGTTWGGTENAFRLPDFSGRFLRGAAAAKDSSVGTYQGAVIPQHAHGKGDLHVAGGQNPGTAEMLFRVGAREEVPGMNFGIYPNGPRGIDENAKSANTIDIIGEPGPAKETPQEALNEQVRPMNAVVFYIIKVK